MSTIKSLFRWTPEIENELRALYGKGHTAKEIAVIIGAPSKNSVIGKIHRMSMPPRKKKEQKARVRPEKKKIKKVVEVATPATGKDLLSIKKNECRWPIEDRLFCACATNEGDVYCETHKKMARRKL